jgi:hypothetical protein
LKNALSSASSKPADLWRLLLSGIAALSGYSVFLFVPRVLQDPDTYWHIAAGDWMLRNLTIPHRDLFSYTFPGAAWVDHEWLAEVLMALAYRAGAWDGVVILFALMTAATFWLLASRLSRDMNPLASLVVFLIAQSCIRPSLLARPHLIALPILVLWVSSLVSAKNKGTPPPPLLLLLVPLWASLHSSIVFGLALILPMALEALMEARSNRGQLARGWGVFLAAATGLSLLTPNGWHELALPFQIARMTQIRHIIEWAPLSFDTLQPIELALLALLFVALYRPIRLPIFSLLTLLGLLHLALHHGRHQMLAGIVGSLILARPLGQALGSPTQEKPAAVRARGWIVAGLGVATLMTAVRLIHPIVRTDDQASPVTALAHVPAELVHEPVLNSYEFGGYLIFKDIKPFIDGRSDVYGDDFIADYSRIFRPDRAAFQRAVDQYGIRWLIVAANGPFPDMMDAMPQWRRLYADRVAVVYALEKR